MQTVAVLDLQHSRFLDMSVVFVFLFLLLKKVHTWQLVFTLIYVMQKLEQTETCDAIANPNCHRCCESLV